MRTVTEHEAILHVFDLMVDEALVEITLESGTRYEGVIIGMHKEEIEIKVYFHPKIQKNKRIKYMIISKLRTVHAGPEKVELH